VFRLQGDSSPSKCRKRLTNPLIRGIVKTSILCVEALLQSRDNPVGCPDVVGKTIQDLKLYRDPVDGAEIQIDFTDGTSFVCCIENQVKMEANLFVCGNGEPTFLRKFELE
jgi:hypothetical protein